ncbi:MAG: hypothetical protein NTW38_09805 [Candidatus Aminicenantes bacterium]|nr:hypothetical protein [Candidatus Aminicenantes bacterium]
MMSGSTSAVSRLFLLAPAAGLAAYGSAWLRATHATILDHGFRPAGTYAILFLALWAAAFFLLTQAVKVSRNTASEAGARLWPLIVLLAAPFLSADYFDRADLRNRLILLGLFVAAAVVYLGATRAAPRPETRRRWSARLTDRFLKMPVKKRLLVLFVTAFLVYNACALVLVCHGLTFSGDEPNYLLTTHSLVADGDINLENNFRNRDYFHFYDEKENPRLRMSPYARTGKKGRDYLYPINLPGISALMVPFYAASQAVHGFARTFILKGSLAIWAALLGLQLYLLARSLWRREGLALGLWALYAFSAPILFYAVHLYPEIPIAFFSITIYRLARSGRPLSPLRLVFMGALLGSFFWFGLKYNLIFWPLLAVAVFYLWPVVRPRSRILWLVVPALIGMGLFYLAVWNMYGTVSPFAVYEGVLEPGQTQAITQSFLDLPFSARVETFLDYFLDQRDGLLPYAPFWAFLFLGLIEMARRGRKILTDLFGLLLIAGPFILNYAFFTHRQGFCPQGRVLAPISWIGAIAVGYFLERRGNRVFKWMFGLGVAAAAAVSLILLRHPNFLYQPTTHDYTTRAGDLFVHLGNVRLFLPPLLPSFIKVDNAGYLPNYVWAGLVILFLGAYLVFGKAGDKPLSRRFHMVAAAALLGGGVCLGVLFPRVPLYPSWPVEYSSGGYLGFYLMPMGRGVVAKKEGELYLHFEKSYRFIFASREKLGKIDLAFGSKNGEHEIRMNFFDAPMPAVRTDREIKKTVFEPKAHYRLRDLYVYEIGLSLKKFSGENLLVDPYFFKISPVR